LSEGVPHSVFDSFALKFSLRSEESFKFNPSDCFCCFCVPLLSGAVERGYCTSPPYHCCLCSEEYNRLRCCGTGTAAKIFARPSLQGGWSVTSPLDIISGTSSRSSSQDDRRAALRGVVAVVGRNAPITLGATAISDSRNCRSGKLPPSVPAQPPYPKPQTPTPLCFLRQSYFAVVARCRGSIVTGLSSQAGVSKNYHRIVAAQHSLSRGDKSGCPLSPLACCPARSCRPLFQTS
jgi:hypothetical protein